MNLKVRLAVMNFLEFAVWGAYLTSMCSPTILTRLRSPCCGNRGIFFLIDLQLANGDAIEHAFAGAYLHSTFSFHLRPGVRRPAFCQKSPRSFPARARLLSRGSDVLAQELLNGLCGCFFIIAFDLDGHGLALLDAHAHQSHQLTHIAALAVLLEGGGACKALHGLDQQAGGTGMDAAGILNGVLKFLHNHFLLT